MTEEKIIFIDLKLFGLFTFMIDKCILENNFKVIFTGKTQLDVVVLFFQGIVPKLVH